MMKSTVLNVAVNKSQFICGDDIEFSFALNVQDGKCGEITSLSIDIFRFEKARDQFSFGFGTSPVHNNSTISIKGSVPNLDKFGVHFVQGVTISWLTDSGERQEYVAFQPRLFLIRNAVERSYSTAEINHVIHSLTNDRFQYLNRIIQTPTLVDQGASGGHFHIMVFGVGCLLRSAQQLEGYYIAPLPKGMTYSRFLELVNVGMVGYQYSQLPYEAEFEKQFESSTPTFLISFRNVMGIDHVDAMDYCRNLSGVIFELLGLDRGQKPMEFACVAIEYSTGSRWRSFHQPWYKGNFLSDFNPVSTANFLESAIPVALNDPFVRLILKTYADGTAEDNEGFALLRFWSVLELLAKRNIGDDELLFDSDRSPILDKRGNPATTKSNLAKVYQYIFLQDAYKSSGSIESPQGHMKFMIGFDPSHPGYTPDTEMLSLWVYVQAAYAVRNSVAHTGQFAVEKGRIGNESEKLASRLMELHGASPRRFIRDQAYIAIRKLLAG